MRNREIRLKDRKTEWGWDVRTSDDLVLALEGDPYFQTVATPVIEEAVENAMYDRREWESVNEIADYIASNYI